MLNKAIASALAVFLHWLLPIGFWTILIIFVLPWTRLLQWGAEASAQVFQRHDFLTREAEREAELRRQNAEWIRRHRVA